MKQLCIDQSKVLNIISILYNYIHQTKFIMNIKFSFNEKRIVIIRSFEECQLLRRKEILNLDI